MSAVRDVPESASSRAPAYLTRLAPDSVTVTGPRRAVSGIDWVRTVDHTVSVRDSGEFVIPLDVKRLAPGVTVRPAEVRLLVHLAPLARRTRDSGRVAALKSR
jgi:hypothetical protein